MLIPHCTFFFLGVLGPAPAALSGLCVSVAQLVSPLETADLGLTRSPLNFGPLRGLRQRGAAPLLNVSSCRENCNEQKQCEISQTVKEQHCAGLMTIRKFHLRYYIWSAVDRGEVIAKRKTGGEGKLLLQKQVVVTGH